MAIVERVYDALYEDEDARACAEIDERACRDVPCNFLRSAAALAVTKLGEAVANTKTTLPWLLPSLGAPGIAGLLVSVRESGSMLPQLVIAKWVRELAVRKWTYVIGAVLQALAMLGIAASAVMLDGTPAGLVILALVILFSLARGLCSVRRYVQPPGADGHRRGCRCAGWGGVRGGLGRGRTDPYDLVSAGGVFLLAALHDGVVSAVVQQFGATAAILPFSAMAFVSAAVVRRLPEVQA